MFRSVQTAVTALATHPYRNKLTLVLCPFGKESLVNAGALPNEFSELQALCESYDFKFDFSEFDEVNKDCWGFDVIQN